MTKKINLLNQRFFRLVVLKEVGLTKWRNVLWQCKCDCGNFCIVSSGNLRNGNTKSCGCYSIEVSTKIIKPIAKLQIGSFNPAWRGDEVGYVGLHEWVKKYLGTPTKCMHCGKDGLIGKKIQWANISGEYRRDLTDWVRLCASCHTRYDGNYLSRDRDHFGKFIQ